MVIFPGIAWKSKNHFWLCWKMKNEDTRLSHDTRYYEYGYQCCIWDLGIILSEQSNYPIKIGPGPDQIVSGDQVSGDHKHFTSPLPDLTIIQTQEQQRVRLFEFQPLKILHCVCKSDHIFKSWIRIMYHCPARGWPGGYLRSICNQFGFYQ